MISKQFGSEYAKLLRTWIKTNIKICTSKQQLRFLLRCRRYNVFPPHIHNVKFNVTFRNNHVNHKFLNAKRQSQKYLLNFEISDINFWIKRLYRDLNHVEERLRHGLPDRIVNDFFKFNENMFTNHNNNTKNKLIIKFNKLIEKQVHGLKSFTDTDRSKWIVNISDRVIPKHILDFLSLGSRFGLPVNNCNKIDRRNIVLSVVKNFETNCYKIHDDLVNEARTLIGNTLNRFLCNKNHLNYIDKFLLRQFSLCKKFLFDNNDLFVTRADKGQITVIMNKSNYNSQMTELLDDRDTYIKLNKNPLNSITSKLNTLIKTWRDGGIISDFCYKHLNCTNGNLPRCYGLPKVHKPGYPLRIIVSTLGSPLYNISCFLHEILHKSIAKPNSHVKDSWSFAKLITEQQIHDNELLISLDVSSLFTNIPRDLVLDGIKRRWNEISKNTKLSLAQFSHAIDLVLSSTSFTFNDDVYEQIYGTPMGSPLSPIIADIVMDDLETSCLRSLNFSVRVFYRYVDDIFTIIPKNKVNEVANIFNCYHPRLHFTFEIETNNAINFLNTTVLREGPRLLTNWHRKHTFSGKYINYFSSHPKRYKVNTIMNLVDQAILLSDARFHSSNLDIVRNILVNNSYPLPLLNKTIDRRVRFLKLSGSVPPQHCDDEVVTKDKKNFITMPYIAGISEEINRVLRPLNFSILYTVPKKLNNIIKTGKDTLSIDRQTEVVYQINCKDCEAIYIGQTKRHVETRLREHRRDISKPPCSQSVVSKHREFDGHEFDWSTPRILHKEPHVRKREVAEMFFIKKYIDKTINLQKDTDNLNAIYDKLIRIT